MYTPGRGKRNNLLSGPGGGTYPRPAPIPRTSYAQGTPYLQTPAKTPGTVAASAVTPGYRTHGSPQHNFRQVDGSDNAIAELVAPLPIPAKVLLNNVSDENIKNYSVTVNSDSGYSWMVVRGHQSQKGWIPSQLMVWNSHNFASNGPGSQVDYAVDGAARSLVVPTGTGKVIAGSGCATVVPLKLPNSPCGVLAVSEDGTVLFWPELLKDGCQTITIAFESTHGDTAKAVTLLPNGDGCVLVTQKGQLFHISITNSYGRPALGYKHISRSAGLLQWGMRSLFGFGGAGPTEDDATCILSIENTDASSNLTLLTKRKIFAWKLTPGQPPDLQFDHDLTAQDGLPVDHSLRSQCVNGDMLQIVDAKLRADGLVILVAIIPSDRGEATRYAIGFGISQTTQPSWFWIPPTPRMQGYRSGSVPIKLLPGAEGANATLVDMLDGKISVIQCDGSEIEDSGSLTVEGPLLGTGFIGSDAVLFSRLDNGAVVRVSHRNLRSEQEAEREAAEVRELATKLPANEQQLAFLSRSFQAFSANMHDNANKLLAEVDNLDVSVASLSASIADAHPEDPRWAETATAADNSSMSSTILLHQLEGKREMHARLLTFLKTMQLRGLSSQRLWDTLSTQREILNTGEKIGAAIAIRSLHPKPRAGGTIQTSDMNRELLDAAIKSAVPSYLGELSANDMFYQTASGVDKLLEPLANETSTALSRFSGWSEKRRLLLISSDILIAVIRQVRQFKTRFKDLYTSLTSSVSRPSSQGWTTTDDFKGHLRRQITLIVDKAIQGNCTVEDLPDMYNRMFEIGDGLLDSYEIFHLKASSSIVEAFEQDREFVLQPFLSKQCPQSDWAYQLAMKHRDFTTLVMLCETEGKTAELERLSLEFGKEFVDARFQWYVEQGRRYQLLNQSDGRATELEQFLQSHKSLGWLQHIHMSQFGKAHVVLRELATTPVQPNFVARKRSLLSLAKLSLMATDEGGEDSASMSAIDHQLFFLKCQSKIPPSTLEAVGHVPDYDMSGNADGVSLEADAIGYSDMIPPLEPYNTIALLIGDNPTIKCVPDDEVRFIEALKMAQLPPVYTSDEGFEDTRLRALAHTIVHDRDRWRAGVMPDDEPGNEIVEATLLFNTVALATFENIPVEGVKCDDLSQLALSLIQERDPAFTPPKQFGRLVAFIVECGMQRAASMDSS